MIPVSAYCAEDNFNEIIEKQIKMVDMDKINEMKDGYIDPETWQIVPQFNVKDTTKKMISGDYSLKSGNIFTKIIKFIAKETYQNSKFMLQIIIIAIICGIITNLQNSFNKSEISNIAFFACYVYIIGIIINNFTSAFNIGKNVIDNMIISMQVMVPILSTMLITSGNITSAAILRPSILFMVQIVAIIIQRYLVPVMFFLVALIIVNNISEKEQISKLITFIKELIKWGLCFFLTIFIAILTIQGFGSAFSNSVGRKTAKFFVGSFIPVIGSVLSDAVEMVMGCSSIIRNATGVIGLILLILICLVPVLKIIALIVIYKITAAVIEPVSDSRITNCVNDLSDILVIVLAVILTVIFMFIISLCVMISAGNISTLLV